MADTTRPLIITGPPGAAKRLNIVDFVKDERMFSLYVQALQAMFQADKDDITSYYQIGGIHGLPFEEWEGDLNHSERPQKAVASETKEPWKGYCNHGSALFPTWHRPYIAAFEQILQSHAARIAEQYTTETSEWRKAAADLRQPFWDWAAPGQAVPPDEVIRLTKVWIRAKPDGKETEVENPLYAYNFKFKIPGSSPPFDKWPMTLRHPKNDQSDPDALAQTLSENQVDWTSKTYTMLILLNTWPEFSNKGKVVNGAPVTSLEGIHDCVHISTGGGGHMGELAVAGFDPIFYLHHTNVDRLLSLWAALHPEVWVTEDKEPEGTIKIPKDSVIDGTTPLFPFANSERTHWTSDESTNTTRLGYTYPEFEGLDMNNPAVVKTAITKIVNKLYSTGFIAAYRPFSRLDSTGSSPSGAATTSPGIPDYMWTWAARVRVQQFELDRSFQVLIFLTNDPEESDRGSSAQSYVGSFGAFVNSAAEQCANCQARLELVTEGYVNLVAAMVKQGVGRFPFNPEDVEENLKKFVQWRVQTADGTPVPIERLTSLEVMVIAEKTTLPLGGVVPVLDGRPVPHPYITIGRPGGPTQL